MKRATKQSPTVVKKKELEAYLKSIGYTEDQYGHFHKELDNGTRLRFKMGGRSTRFERRTRIGDRWEWVNLKPCCPLYYKNFHLDEQGKASFRPLK